MPGYPLMGRSHRLDAPHAGHGHGQRSRSPLGPCDPALTLTRHAFLKVQYAVTAQLYARIVDRSHAYCCYCAPHRTDARLLTHTVQRRVSAPSALRAAGRVEYLRHVLPSGSRLV